MQFDVGTMIRRARRTRQKRIVLAAIAPTVAQRQALQRIYMQVVRGWGRRAYERIMPTYKRTLAETAGVRDSVDDVTGDTNDVAAELSRLVLTLTASLEDWVVQVEMWHRGRFGQLFTASGVNIDTLLGQDDVRVTLQAVLAENIALIKSVNEQMHSGISGAVFRGLTNRMTAAEVGREIRRLTGVATSRAELIASDQLQKLTGRLDQERQEQAGIKGFEWLHSHKLHPRQYHVARDGQTFAWDSVVGRTDPPGRAIRCGCRARPVVIVPEGAEGT